MTGLVPARDIPIQVISPAASSERRINPSWTISQLKAKLEPITGIAPSLQTLTLRLPDRLDGVVISTGDEDLTEIGSWSLAPYAELHVCRTFFLSHFWRSIRNGGSCRWPQCMNPASASPGHVWEAQLMVNLPRMIWRGRVESLDLSSNLRILCFGATIGRLSQVACVPGQRAQKPPRKMMWSTTRSKTPSQVCQGYTGE